MKFLIALLMLPGVAAANVTSFRNNYASTSVTTSSPLTVISSVVGSYAKVSVFDSSGQTMKLIITSPSGTTQTMIIPPGGGGFPLAISQGYEVQLEAITATASTGEIDINFFN